MRLRACAHAWGRCALCSRGRFSQSSVETASRFCRASASRLRPPQPLLRQALPAQAPCPSGVLPGVRRFSASSAETPLRAASLAVSSSDPVSPSLLKLSLSHAVSPSWRATLRAESCADPATRAFASPWQAHSVRRLRRERAGGRLSPADEDAVPLEAGASSSGSMRTSETASRGHAADGQHTCAGEARGQAGIGLEKDMQGVEDFWGSVQSRFDRILQTAPTCSPALDPPTTAASASSSAPSSPAPAVFSPSASVSPSTRRSAVFPTPFSDSPRETRLECILPLSASAQEGDEEALLQRLLREHGIVGSCRQRGSAATSSESPDHATHVENGGEASAWGERAEEATLLTPPQAPTSVAEAVGGSQRVPIDPNKSRAQLDEEVKAAISHFVPHAVKRKEKLRKSAPEEEEQTASHEREKPTAASQRDSFLAEGPQEHGDPGGEASRSLARVYDERDDASKDADGEREDGAARHDRVEYMGDAAFAESVLGVVSRPRVSGQLRPGSHADRPSALVAHASGVSERLDTKDSSAEEQDGEEEELTPAQRFYRDNRELLLKRAQAYYHEKQQKLARQPSEPLSQEHETNVFEDDETEAVDDEWAFFREPVVRPPKDHLWGVAWQQPAESPATGQRRAKTVELERGRMPTVEEFVTILQQEHMEDIRVVDLDACGRRDVARFAIVGTGRTPEHCRRVGRLLSRLIVELQVPFLSRAAYCHSSRDDDWVIARCAHIHLHLMTRTVRSQYRLEDLWLLPHEHFGPDTFPGYFDCSYSHPPPYLLAARDAAAASSASAARDIVAYESLMESKDYPDASVHFLVEASAPPSEESTLQQTTNGPCSTCQTTRHPSTKV
ncbi:hypothetical protein BESB_080350 [Besnoitia besnoiti]|uniref:Oligomerization domain protein n=1 Tax=Besnoitia besnoiti TaxID=94643 RepID=A0A2A9M7A3_BESBE|nr:hypothetical protein BESB_080350 [Besnoitia besnoiti]PFH33819.1 hypothetical protein BESB_080350 [Besnoitia besnoiti]